MNRFKKNQNKLLGYLGIIIFSCTEQYSDSNSSYNNSDNIFCGIDTTFALPLPAVDIARYSDCRYILAGIYGTELLDEMGNVLPSWEDNGMRVPSTRGFNPTSDGGFLTTYINFVSKASPPNAPGNGCTTSPRRGAGVWSRHRSRRRCCRRCQPRPVGRQPAAATAAPHLPSENHPVSATPRRVSPTTTNQTQAMQEASHAQPVAAWSSSTLAASIALGSR